MLKVKTRMVEIMTEEIKKILDRLEYDKDDIYYIGFVDGINIDNTFLPKDIKLLLNYITNLQKENEILQKDNESLKRFYNDLVNKSRNEKAIEYLKHHIPIIIKYEDGGWCNANIYFENGTLIVKPNFNILFDD